MEENYTRQAVRGAGIAFLMGILAALVAYATKVVLARSLGPQDYGLFSSLLAFIVFFLFLRDLGLLSALVKYIAGWKVNGEYGKIKSALLGVGAFQLASSLFFVGIASLLSGVLAERYFQDQRAKVLLWLFLLYVLSSVFFILVKAVFRGFQQMFLFSSVELLKNAVVLAGVLVFLFLGKGVFAPVLAYVLVSPILCVLYVPFASRTCRFFSTPSEQFVRVSRTVISYGIPLFAVSLADRTMSYIDTLLLTHFRTLEEVGVYNAVLPSAFMLLFVGRALSTVVFPLSAEFQARNDLKRLQAGVSLLHKYLFLFLIPAIAALASGASLLIPGVFGEAYASGVLTFQVLLVGMLLFIMAIVDTNVLSAVGQAKRVAAIVGLGAIVNLGFNLVLIPQYGIIGAGFATFTSYALTFFLAEDALRKHLHIPSPWKQWAWQAGAGTIFFGVASGVQLLTSFNPWVEWITGILAATLVYFGILLLGKQMDFLELLRLGKRLR